MKNYFRLNIHCELVEGKNKACIYDLFTGDMISLDIEKYNILKKCEKNILLDNIPDIDYDFLKKLQTMNLGTYYSKPVYIDKLQIGPSQTMKKILSENYSINTFYIEINNKCNFDCIFCTKDSNTLFRKTGCKRWKLSTDIIDLDTIRSSITQIAKLGCNHIVFIGGEPLLELNLLKELAKHISSNKINKISIYTNAYLINEEIKSFLKEYNISLNMQLLSNNNTTYKNITGVSQAFDTIVNNIKDLIKSGIVFNQMILVNRSNECEIDETIKYFENLTGNKKIKLEYIYPVPYNEYYSDKFKDLLYNKQKYFQKCNVQKYSYIKKYHNCYGNNLAMTLDGNIIPCIMSRGLVLGNIKNDEIYSILKTSDYNNLKCLTKDNIDKCKECSYKYGCFDCRAIEMSATNNLNGMEYCNLKI